MDITLRLFIVDKTKILTLVQSLWGKCIWKNCSSNTLVDDWKFVPRIYELEKWVNLFSVNSFFLYRIGCI